MPTGEFCRVDFEGRERRTAGGLVVVHVDALELEVGVAAVGAGGVDAVLIADNLNSGERRRSVKVGGAGRKGSNSGRKLIPSQFVRSTRTHLPELSTDLVTALTTLDVNDLTTRGEGRCFASALGSG